MFFRLYNANTPGFSCSDIWSFKENSTICEKKTRRKATSIHILGHPKTIDNRWQCYFIICQFQVWELSRPIQCFPSATICDNEYYSCLIFPLCAGENETSCLSTSWPENKVRKTQVATNGEWKQTLRVSRHFPKIVTLLSKSGNQGLVLSIFSPLLFSDSHGEKPGGLSYPQWDINKWLMRGNGPRNSI